MHGQASEPRIIRMEIKGDIDGATDLLIDLPFHHLYVSEMDARPLNEHLRFRNALRQDPELAAEYAALKRAFADQYRHDRDAYTEAKTGFIRSVIDGLFAKPN